MFINHSEPLKLIEVTENDNYFLVQISAKDRFRARKLPGRRWDPKLVSWVYPKTLECYEALEEEFSRDANIFEIKKPQRKTSREYSITNGNQEDRELEYKSETVLKKKASVSQSLIEISDKIDDLTSATNHVEDIANSIEKMILGQNLESSLLEEKSENSNISATEKVEQLEEELKRIAFECSGQDESLKHHLEKFNPLGKPDRFVLRTHEKLARHLSEKCGYSDPRESNFISYANASEEKGYIDKSTKNTLISLNHHRNIVAHPPDAFSEYKFQNRSIAYLMGIALIWGEVASEPLE